MRNVFAMVYLIVANHDVLSLSKAFLTSFVKTENCQMIYKKKSFFVFIFLLCFNAAFAFKPRINPINPISFS